MNAKTLAVLVLIIGGAVMLRELFPKRTLVASPPRITTVFDTVRTLDTLWLRKTVTRAETLYRERVTVTPPETVRVAPVLVGLTGLVVAPFVGDSTVAQGFRGEPAGTGYAVSGWRVQYYTSGPLRAFALVDGVPRLAFAPPPKPPCTLGCTLKHYLTGMAVGAAAWELVR